MTIHHLNCGTMRPPGGPLMVCHCLVIESPGGLTLVDTGIGAGAFLGFTMMVGAALDLSETMPSQLERLGYQRSDVRDIVVTHLDVDHAGALAHFPQARVHLHAAELRAALSPTTASERRRYRSSQWAHGPKWVTYGEAGEPWHGLEARPLQGVDGVALVPLAGHSRGHSGVAVQEEGLLHAGDAYYFHGELGDPTRCPAHLRLAQRAVATDHALRLANLDRLRHLPPSVRVFSAHDAGELASFG
ncbi:MBL fold metallo-hydrolase [Nonomuraea sp. NPDC050556]|uniref:MBL fold metallo-hydrolase n=1 Tax=Nonomuraea sp. NPDC050556 TaxID=3364369 RepID=UPI0037B1F70E